MFNEKVFSVKQKEEIAKTALKLTDLGNGIYDLKVTFDFPEKMIPEVIKVTWSYPMYELLSVWSPIGGRDRTPGIDWLKKVSASRLGIGSPVLAMTDPLGNSRLTVGVSDAKTPLEIRCGVSEESKMMACETDFFTSAISPITHYEATIRLDTRHIPFTETVADISKWWEQDCGYKRADVPEYAKLPMNSAWYSFHQALDPDKLLHECELSAAYGLKTIIIDDGWQTDNNSRGYAYCGDWELYRGKIPDMKELVDRIHKTGMKVMLWYGVPFVGIHSKAFERFRNKALYWRKTTAIILDIRYPDVREYLVSIYKKALEEWDLDGLKLDFIDSFMLTKDSPEYNEEMDYSSVEDAVEALLEEIRTALTEVKPDAMIEFRQNYIGPVMQKYGNMLRVSDCPYDSMQNRTSIIDLRLTSGKTAVHSDMLMWHPEDSVYGACLQILATLFGVPQISVLFDTLPEDHKKALAFWMSFCVKYKDVLQDGKLTAKNSEACYSQASSSLNGTTVTVNYMTVPFEVGESKKHLFVNSTMYDRSVVTFAKPEGMYDVTIYNCMGEIHKKLTVDAKNGVAILDLPACGLAELNRI